MRAHESTQKGVDEKWREILSSFNTLRATWMPAKKLVESLLIQRPHTVNPLETQRLQEVSWIAMNNSIRWSSFLHLLGIDRDREQDQ